MDKLEDDTAEQIEAFTRLLLETPRHLWSPDELRALRALKQQLEGMVREQQ